MCWFRGLGLMKLVMLFLIRGLRSRPVCLQAEGLHLTGEC